MTRVMTANFDFDRDKKLGIDDTAYVDALSHMAKLDPPEVYARYIPVEFVTALVNAVQVRQGFRLPYETTKEQHREMSLLGLTDMRDPFLTAYAIKVRRAIREGRD